MGCGEEAWSTIAVRGAINGCDVDGFGEALNLEAGTVRSCVHARAHREQVPRKAFFWRICLGLFVS